MAVMNELPPHFGFFLARSLVALASFKHKGTCLAAWPAKPTHKNTVYRWRVILKKGSAAEASTLLHGLPLAFCLHYTFYHSSVAAQTKHRWLAAASGSHAHR